MKSKKEELVRKSTSGRFKSKVSIEDLKKVKGGKKSTKADINKFDTDFDEAPSMNNRLFDSQNRNR